MHLVDDLIGREKFGPVVVVYALSDVKDDEIIATLGITSWSCSDGANSMCVHAVVMFLMSLHILTKFQFVAGIEIHLTTKDDLQWTLSGGDASWQNKHVPLEDTMIDHIDDEHGS